MIKKYSDFVDINIYDSIIELNIEDAYKFVMDNNKSYNLPYHNEFHLEQVCKFALKGAEFYDLSIEDKKCLAVAALFHDINHTGSGKNDDINIEIAIDSFKEFATIANYDSIDIEKIIALIKVTRFPYITEANTTIEKIMRDSDIIQGSFMDNYINGVVFALAKEAKIDKKDMIQNQIKFLKNMKFCTSWATNLFKTKLDYNIKLLNTVNKIY